jgi:hypothetical protein
MNVLKEKLFISVDQRKSAAEIGKRTDEFQSFSSVIELSSSQWLSSVAGRSQVVQDTWPICVIR